MIISPQKNQRDAIRMDVTSLDVFINQLEEYYNQTDCDLTWFTNHIVLADLTLRDAAYVYGELCKRIEGFSLILHERNKKRTYLFDGRGNHCVIT